MNGFMQLIKDYYERVIAVVVMLVLLGFSGWLIFRVLNIKADIQTQQNAAAATMDVKPSDIQSVRNIQSKLLQPPAWTTNASHRLFIAPLVRMNPKTGALYLSDEDAINRFNIDGINMGWLRKNELLTRAGVGREDPDGDGFSNFLEFKNDTNPKDPQSKPDIVVLLRFKDLVRKPFPFQFAGVNVSVDGRDKFSIRPLRNSGDYWVYLDEVVPDKIFPGYKVIKFEKKEGKVPDKSMKDQDGKPVMVSVDISELTLQKGDEKPVVLVKGKSAHFEDPYARLLFLPTNKTYELRQKDHFKLQGHEYEVISIKKVDSSSAEVLVKRVDSPKEYSVPLLTNEETSPGGFSNTQERQER